LDNGIPAGDVEAFAMHGDKTHPELESLRMIANADDDRGPKDEAAIAKAHHGLFLAKCLQRPVVVGCQSGARSAGDVVQRVILAQQRVPVRVNVYAGYQAVVPGVQDVAHERDLYGEIGAGIDAGIELVSSELGEICGNIAITNQVNQTAARADGMAAPVKNSDGVPGVEQFVYQVASLKTRAADKQYVHFCDPA